MFTETTGSRKAIGDVHLLFHEGLYHLFHLVLPNHDFIAHAVSTDGIHWRRVSNALFIGDPGSWDDLMLWTMHVSPNPHRKGGWRMFYTGISRRDRGAMQRIGLAHSDDLYHWKKHPVNWEDGRGPDDPELVQQARRIAQRTGADEIVSQIDENSCFPISPDPLYYEDELVDGRGMVSFRDPYFVELEQRSLMLVSARVNNGPNVRRGCIALLEETAPNQFTSLPPILHPCLYDDIEVPNLFTIDDQLYLVGSIREDAKIRYWHASADGSGWKSYHENVLMPQGNYAARICNDENGWLLWCFFAMNREDRTDENLMPPPKRLARADDGSLYVKTYEGIDAWCREPLTCGELQPLKPSGKGEISEKTEGVHRLGSKYGFQAFTYPGEMSNFRLDFDLSIENKGKCGLVFRLDPESHDGYYLSLDLLKGLAQLRSWGTNHAGGTETLMEFHTLQMGFWTRSATGSETMSLITFGSYIEFSVGGRVLLSLADRSFRKGLTGFYLDSCTLKISNLQLCPLHEPEQEDNQLVGG